LFAAIIIRAWRNHAVAFPPTKRRLEVSEPVTPPLGTIDRDGWAASTSLAVLFAQLGQRISAAE